MNFKIIKALVVKEAKQIKRDPSNWVVAFIFPILLLVIFGYGLSFNIENIGIDLVMHDTGKLSQDLANSYTDSKYFNTNVVYSLQDAKGNLEAGKTQGIVIIPENFSKNFVSESKKPSIQIISDGSDPNTAVYIEGYAEGIFSRWMMKQLNARPPINIIDRIWFNPSTETVNFMLAGALTMILSIAGAFMTSMVVAREWERGTMEALISTPVSIWEIIASKIIPYFVLSVVAFVFSLVVSKILFGVPFEGSVFATSLVTSIFIIVALLIGLIISNATKDQFNASMGVMAVTFLPTMMLSGFIFEIKSMPMWLQLITYAFPARYYVACLRTLCLVGDVWPIILRNAAVLLSMATGLALVLRKNIKKKIA
ncbi:MAG: ABC transporter permease [Holosporales bacterium]|nr:ABC transporter permease [Holosporales bacterium]